jgi:hypothetical protein
MKNVLKVLLVLFVLAIPALAIAQATAADIIIPVPGLEATWVDAALAIFGIGLVYIINFVKGLLGLADKKAVLLTIGFGIAAALATLILKSALTIPNLVLYSLAVVGELTGWFKLVAKPKKSPVA